MSLRRRDHLLPHNLQTPLSHRPSQAFDVDHILSREWEERLRRPCFGGPVQSHSTNTRDDGRRSHMQDLVARPRSNRQVRVADD